MLRVITTLLRIPALWPEAVRAAAALARPGWYRRLPFLPLPDRAYLRWRIATAYGDPRAPIRPEDVVSYLRWRQRQRNRGGR